MPRELDYAEITDLESLIDVCGLRNILHAMARVCQEKADHIRSSYDDKNTAAVWKKAARELGWAGGCGSAIDLVSR